MFNFNGSFSFYKIIFSLWALRILGDLCGFCFFTTKRGGDAEKTEPCTQPIFDGWARRECIYAFPASTPQAFNVCRKN